MAVQRGPTFDRVLMRIKDIVWLCLLLWGILKGIDAYKDRLKNLESTVMATNIRMASVETKLKEIDDNVRYLRWNKRRNSDEN
jgi:hypothetical protein